MSGVASPTPLEAWDEVFVRCTRQQVNAVIVDPASWGVWWPGIVVEQLDDRRFDLTITARAPIPARHHLVVTVDLDTDDLEQLPLGATVALELPDGAATTGTVATVGVDAEAADSDEETTTDPTVPVIITLDDPTATDIESGTVAVTVETSREDDVVAVDVAALVALAEGGYAVEVVDGAATQLVAVEVGTFVDGWVGVTGVEPGTTVVVPS